MRKATVAKGQMHSEKHDKSEEKPQDCAPIFSMYHLTAEDLIKLSQLCHDYLTAVTLFFVTLCSLTANAVLETASVKNLDIRFFFA